MSISKVKCFVCGSIRGNQSKITLSDGRVVHNFHRGVGTLCEGIVKSEGERKLTRFECGCEVLNSDLQTCSIHNKPILLVSHQSGLHIAKVISERSK